MATNVTEKDKTLHEVIDFLQKEWDAANWTMGGKSSTSRQRTHWHWATMRPSCCT